jgi:hypothetical protein
MSGGASPGNYLLEDARLSFWFRSMHAVRGEDIQEQMGETVWDARPCCLVANCNLAREEWERFVGSGRAYR